MKKLWILLTFTALAACLSVTAMAAVGDANNDRKITSADARYVLRAAVELEFPDYELMCRCDVDHDGKLTAADARKVLRVAVELDQFTHPAPTGNEPIVGMVPATCTEPGRETYRCSCGDTFQREIPAKGHIWDVPVTENTRRATCTADGGYDTVIYCKACHAEQSREHTVLPMLAHTPGAAVRENAVAPTCLAEGGYDMATYCEVCGNETGRTHVTEEKLSHTLSLAPVIAYIGERPAQTELYSCEACGKSFTDDTAETEVPGAYTSLNAAMRRANKGDTAVLMTDWTQTEDLRIPEGVTLLLPLAQDYTPVNAADDKLPYANTRTVTDVPAVTPAGEQVSLTLTLSGCTLTVEDGALLCLGGEYSGLQPIGGGTYGPHAEIGVQTDAAIEVNGVMSVYGYVTGGGEVRLTGGALYEPLVITDFHGGTYSAISLLKEQSAPFNGYAFVNIQCPMRASSQASIYVYCALYATSVQNAATSVIVSPDKGLLKTGEDAVLTFTYDPDVQVAGFPGIGRTTVTAEGDVRVQSLELRAAGIRMQSELFAFPMPCFLNYTQASGTLTVAQAVKVMPGAVLTVGENASLSVEKALYVTDGFAAGQYSAFHYPSAEALAAAGLSARAHLILDGVMTVHAGAVFAGIAETNGTGSLTLDEAATLSATLTDGLILNDVYFGLTAIATNKTEYALTARLFNQNGEFAPVEAGKTYVASPIAGKSTLNGFTYVRYTGDIESFSSEEIHADYPSPETMLGGWNAVTN